MREVKLPSGATLKLAPAPFKDAKALYQALLAELRTVSIDAGDKSAAELYASVYKDLFCIGFSSKAIEACIWKCLERCLYNDFKVNEDTFEPVAARDDYMVVCMEAVKENVGPFAKSLFAEYKRVTATTASTP